jgi:hypothetical protein
MAMGEYFVWVIETARGVGSSPLASREDIGVRVLVPQTDERMESRAELGHQVDDLPQRITQVKLRMRQTCCMVGTMCGGAGSEEGAIGG